MGTAQHQGVYTLRGVLCDERPQCLHIALAQAVYRLPIGVGVAM